MLLYSTVNITRAQLNTYTFTHSVVDLDTIIHGQKIKPLNIIYLYHSWCSSCKSTVVNFQKLFVSDSLDSRLIRISAYEYDGAGTFEIKSKKGQKRNVKISVSPVIFIYAADQCIDNQMDYIDKRIKRFKENSRFLTLSNTRNISGLIMDIEEESGSLYQKICNKRFHIPVYLGFGFSNDDYNLEKRSDLLSNEGTLKNSFSNYYLGAAYQMKLGAKYKASYFSVGLGAELCFENFSLTSDSILQKFNSVDIDGENYIKHIQSKNYVEENNLISVCFPLTVKFNYKVNRSLMLGMGVSPSLRYLFSDETEKSGIFSQIGFYDDYGTISNSDRLGFKVNQKVTDNTGNDFSQLSILYRAQIDATLNLSKNLKSIFGLTYTYSKIPTSEPIEVISPDFKTINSPYTQDGNFVTSYIGAFIGIRF
jgi:hypothetical protein